MYGDHTGLGFWISRRLAARSRSVQKASRNPGVTLSLITRTSDASRWSGRVGRDLLTQLRSSASRTDAVRFVTTGREHIHFVHFRQCRRSKFALTFNRDAALKRNGESPSPGRAHPCGPHVFRETLQPSGDPVAAPPGQQTLPEPEVEYIDGIRQRRRRTMLRDNGREGAAGARARTIEAKHLTASAVSPSLVFVLQRRDPSKYLTRHRPSEPCAEISVE